jgi:fimbrial chaperone protein
MYEDRPKLLVCLEISVKLTSFKLRRRYAAAGPFAVILFVALCAMPGRAQSLSVLPVNVLMQPGQSAATLTVTNQAGAVTSIQVRVYSWNQDGGEDHLTSSDAVVVSPPIASIPPGATQVVRLILRQPPQGREATYRILVDQIPPAAEPGIVRVVLRLSIPIFAEPVSRALPLVRFQVESDAGQIYLVAANHGLRHEAIRNIVLSTTDGRRFLLDRGTLPYVLAGATRRWHITAGDSLPQPGATLRLTAHADAGAIDEQVSVVARP